MENKVKKTSKEPQKFFTTQNKKEQGITLISLLITIIVLIILMSIIVKTVAKNDGILATSKDIANEYNIEQYEDQIEALRDSVIYKYEMVGREIDLSEIAKGMNEESTWIKSAVANLDKSITNEDIVVTTTDDYVYQLYYDEGSGQRFIEYLGIEEGKAFPTAIARYNEETSQIEVSTNVERARISKIELIHRGEIVGETTEKTKNFNVEKSGWYIVRVTSSEDKLRYAWVRISSTIKAPTIVISEHGAGEPENSWYGKSNQVVKATITAEGERSVGLHYTIDNWKNDIEVNGKQAITEGINKVGRTTIYAYAVDEKGNESEITKLDINYDNIPPEVGEVKIKGTKGDNGWYRGEVGISFENAKDLNSGLDGYYYAKIIDKTQIPEIKDMTYVQDIKRELSIAEDRNIRNSSNNKRQSRKLITIFNSHCKER